MVKRSQLVKPVSSLLRLSSTRSNIISSESPCQDGLWSCQDAETMPRSLLIKDVLWANRNQEKDAKSNPFNAVQNILSLQKYSELCLAVRAFTIHLFVFLLVLIS